MRYCILPIILIAFCQNCMCQQDDSTDAFKLMPMEKIIVSQGTINNGNTLYENFRDSIERSSFLILDNDLRKCNITAKLIEYRNGEKIREVSELVIGSTSKKLPATPSEDSLFVFSLSRKAVGNNKFLWAFRTRSAIKVDSVEMVQPQLYRTCALLYNQEKVVEGKQIITQKIPIGKPFVFIAISTWNKESDFPGLSETRQLDKVYDWNKIYHLEHTFLVELTINRPFGSN